MHRLVEINSKDDIFSQYRNTPIGDMLEYHDLERSFETYVNAQLLIGMCMDNRKHLRIPDNFAFIIRSGGANLRYSEFKISYAIAVGGVRHIAIMGHNNCGMVGLHNRKQQFIDGLVSGAGWTKEQAEDHYNQFAPLFEIGNEVDFVTSEAKRLRQRYPQITIAPMLYKVETNKIYLIDEN